MRLFIIYLFSFFFSFQGFSQEKNTLYEVGFTTIVLTDSSRVYKAGTFSEDKLHYRPVELDVWYPSTGKTDTSLQFGDLFKLFEQRAIKYQDTQDYTGMTDELAQLYAMESGLTAEDGASLLKVSTDSYMGLRSIAHKQPLIIYMASYNGMGFENYKLLESLAKKGYIIVSIWSVGRYPGDMTTNKLDMIEQVYDAEYAINFLKRQGELNIDFDKIGVIGCSWGGISGAVFAGRNPKVAAMVTLDGTENYNSGENEEEDKNLKEIFDSANLVPVEKYFSYLCLKSEPVAANNYSYFRKITAEKYYLRFLNSRHADFLCISSLLNHPGSPGNIYSIIIKASQLFFDEHLKGSKDFMAYYASLDTNGFVSKNSNAGENDIAATDFIRAKVVDAITNAALPFVNVGVVNRETGTVTNERGEFELKISTESKSDTIRISMVGYKSQTYKVSELSRTEDVVINLQNDIRQLNQVVVTGRKLKKKTVGNKTTSRFISTPFTYNQLGAEIGTRINIQNAPVFVDTFNFNIAHNRLKHKAWFRFNIYDTDKGLPSKNLLRENILIPVEAMQTGLISVNLKPYDIVLNDDVIIALEWVKNEGEPQKGEAIFFSLGLFSKATLVRHSSQGKMKKHGSMGVGFNLDVRY